MNLPVYAGVLDQNLKLNASAGLPPREFRYEETSHCGPEDRYFASSAVFPSLPLTINWLRGCVRENPSLRIQVHNTAGYITSITTV